MLLFGIVQIVELFCKTIQNIVNNGICVEYTHTEKKFF